MIRADVPVAATKQEMEGWCAEISHNEGAEKSVVVEFLEDGTTVRQKGVCIEGKVLPPASIPGVNVSIR